MNREKVVSLPKFTERRRQRNKEEDLRSLSVSLEEQTLDLACLIDDFVDDLSEAFSDEIPKHTPKAR